MPTTVPPCCLKNLPVAVDHGADGLVLSVSEGNMLVFGCVPHSEPSKAPPVTGIPACWAYFAPRKKSGEFDTIPTAPSEIACWTAVVVITVGLVWSSITIPTSLCPFTPPAAFWAAILRGEADGRVTVLGSVSACE